jgi:hypothetical protein
MYDRPLRINTCGMIKPAELGINHEESVEYTAVGDSALYRTLRSVPIAASSISFLDLGSGKGRAIAVAATFRSREYSG